MMLFCISLLASIASCTSTMAQRKTDTMAANVCSSVVVEHLHCSASQFRCSCIFKQTSRAAVGTGFPGTNRST